MPDCIFCQIVSEEKPCYKIYEDEHFLAFLDIYPKSPGHTLIIPKTHYRWLWDLPQPGELLNFAQKLIPKYQSVFHTDVFFTKTLGLKVAHAHLHFLPQNVSPSLSLSQIFSLLSTT